MILPTTEVYELEIQQFWAAHMFEEKQLTSVRDSKVFLRFMLENLAYQLTALMKVPADVLRRDEEVARWPASKWDNFLVAVGLSKYAKFKRLHFTEMLLFPDIEIPPERWASMRIYTQSAIKGG